MNTKELKPCPFCGGNALLRLKGVGIEGSSHREDWEIFCSNCGATPSKVLYVSKFIITATGELEYAKDGRIEAIEAWNRRTTDE
jgi:Lar family restriction alleviation protein